MEVLDIFKMSPLKGIHRVSRRTPYGSCDIEKCKHVILKLEKKVKSFLCFPLQFYQVVRLSGCQVVSGGVTRVDPWATMRLLTAVADGEAPLRPPPSRFSSPPSLMPKTGTAGLKLHSNN